MTTPVQENCATLKGNLKRILNEFHPFGDVKGRSGGHTLDAADPVGARPEPTVRTRRTTPGTPRAPGP
jgi:hypothetical protein